MWGAANNGISCDELLKKSDKSRDGCQQPKSHAASIIIAP
jgi:hypothetical protein